MKAEKGLAVQSYCFRSIKDNAAVIDAVKACGLKAVELCGVHVNFDDPASFQGIVDAYTKAGISIVSAGVNGIAGDEAAADRRFQFVKMAGAKHMSVDFNLAAVPGAYRIAEKLAEKYDMRLGIHNHGGRHWLGSMAMIQKVLSETSERIGVCMDTAWALHSHEDPVQMAEKLGKRLFGLHLKDFTFDRSGKHTDVVVGTGNLDLSKLSGVLAKTGFSGCVVIEYEGDVNSPVPSVTECVKAVRAAVPELA